MVRDICLEGFEVLVELPFAANHTCIEMSIQVTNIRKFGITHETFGIQCSLVHVIHGQVELGVNVIFDARTHLHPPFT